jgi:hypothetical protein
MLEKCKGCESRPPHTATYHMDCIKCVARFISRMQSKKLMYQSVKMNKKFNQNELINEIKKLLT